jgi:hypothetical protein
MQYTHTTSAPRLHSRQGKDFTFATEGGPTFEEWADGAADRAAAAEAEAAAAAAAAAVEAAAEAAAAAARRDNEEAAAELQGAGDCRAG